MKWVQNFYLLCRPNNHFSELHSPLFRPKSLSAYPSLSHPGFLFAPQVASLSSAIKLPKTYALRGQGHHVKTTSVIRASHEVAHVIHTDIPLSLGGTDSAPQPVCLLLAALIGCEQATAAFVAMKMRLKLGNLDFDLQAVRDNWGAISSPIQEDSGTVARLQRVWGEVKVQSTASQSEIDQLAEQVHKRCPIANMIESSGCKLELKWVAVPYENPNSTKKEP